MAGFIAKPVFFCLIFIMKTKLDKEDLILLTLSIVLFIANALVISIGVYLYPDFNLPSWYLLLLICFIVFFVFAILSLIVKLYNQRKINHKNKNQK